MPTIPLLDLKIGLQDNYDDSKRIFPGIVKKLSIHSLSIHSVTLDFDLSLSYQISWTDYASFNRIFLMKHLTQKVLNDSLSAVTKPPGGSKELAKFETSKGINFCYSYPIFIIFLPFDFIFKWLSKLVVSFTNSKPFSQN